MWESGRVVRDGKRIGWDLCHSKSEKNRRWCSWSKKKFGCVTVANCFCTRGIILGDYSNKSGSFYNIGRYICTDDIKLSTFRHCT